MNSDRANRIRSGLGLPPLDQVAAIGITRPPDQLRDSAIRPGTVFAIVIKWITGANPCPNKCLAHIREMNAWGWWKCWINRKTIAHWLAEEARRRGHQITDAAALDLIKAAFKELKSCRQQSRPIPPTDPLPRT